MREHWSEQVLDRFDRVLTPAQARDALLQLDPSVAQNGSISARTQSWQKTDYLTLIGTRALPAGPLTSMVSYTLAESGLQVRSTLQGSFDSSQPLPSELGVARGALSDPQKAKREVERDFGFEPQGGITNFFSGPEGTVQSLSWKRQNFAGQEHFLSVSEKGARRLDSKLSQGESPESLPSAYQSKFSQWGTNLTGVEKELFRGLDLSPQELWLSLTKHDKGEDLNLSWQLGREKDTRCTVGVDLIERQEGGRNVRSFHVPGTRLPAEAQGKGLGKTLLSNTLSLARHLGAEKIDLEAGMDVGGYAWAKFGFQLADSGEDLNRAVAEKMSTLELDQATQKQVAKILESPDPKRVWQLADLSTEVMVEGRPLKLGKALLLGSQWKATLPLDDQAAVTRCEQYCSAR